MFEIKFSDYILRFLPIFRKTSHLQGSYRILFEFHEKQELS